MRDDALLVSFITLSWPPSVVLGHSQRIFGEYWLMNWLRFTFLSTLHPKGYWNGVPAPFPTYFLGCSSSLLFGLFPSRFFTLLWSVYVRGSRRMLLMCDPEHIPSFSIAHKSLPTTGHFNGLTCFSGHSIHWLHLFFSSSLPGLYTLVLADQTDNSPLPEGPYIFSPSLYSYNTLCQKSPLTPLSAHPFLYIFRS